MAKNTKNSKVNNRTIDSGNEMGKFVLMIVIVATLFLIFYGITILLTKEKEKEENTTTKAPSIQYDTILLGNLLKQSDDKYYVLIGDQDDDNILLYESYLQVYEGLKEHDMVYYSVLNHPMNIRFKGDETKTDITDILDLKIKGTTLVYVEKGKITKTYDNEETLLKILKEISKVKEEKTEE